MSLLFNSFSRLVLVFLPRRKSLNFMAAVIMCSDFGAQESKVKSVTVSIVSPSIWHEVMGLNVMILVLWMLSFKPTFPLSSFTFNKRLFSSSLLSAIRDKINININTGTDFILKLLIRLYIILYDVVNIFCIWDKLMVAQSTIEKLPFLV